MLSLPLPLSSWGIEVQWKLDEGQVKIYPHVKEQNKKKEQKKA